MEKVEAPECCPIHWRHNEAFAIHFGVYAERNPDEVRQEKAERRSDQSGEPFLWGGCLTDNR